MDQQTLAMLGIKDPAEGLSNLGIYSGAQMAGQAQQAQAQGQSQPMTFEQLWAAKYGQPGNAAQPGIKSEEAGGNEIFPLPGNMPLHVNTGPGGSPEYNPEIGEVLGFGPDGQVMTSKTHPYLAGFVGKGRGLWSGGGDAGGNPDGGRSDGSGEE
jgi:hypothetical protein